MAKYTVWFEQLNQQAIKVKSKTPEKALEKAKKEWKATNTLPPANWYMEDEKGDEVK